MLKHSPNREEVWVCSLSESDSRTTQLWGFTPPPPPHSGPKQRRVAWTTNQWWSSLMKRQGLSGDNKRQQEPSQTIWARTHWWMRWALGSHLAPVRLVSNPLTSVWDGEQPVSPFISIPFTMLESFTLLQTKQTYQEWQRPITSLPNHNIHSQWGQTVYKSE